MCKEAIKLILPIIGTILTIIILRTIMGVGIFEGGQFGAFGLGPLWFLVALFWARIILQLISFLCRKTFVIDSPWILLVCSVIVSALAYYFRFMFPYYHICFLHGIIAIQFVAMGWVAQKYKCPIWLQVVFVLFWIIALRYGDLNMVLYEYKCYPLDILGSVGGTLVIYYLSKGMEYLNSQYSKLFRWPCAVINWCGRYSLLILCLHTIDMRALHVISKMISLN